MEDSIIRDGITYISTNVAARLSGYTRDYVGQLAREGRVESIKVGRARFVDKESLLTYVNEQTEEDENDNETEKVRNENTSEEPEKEQDEIIDATGYRKSDPVSNIEDSPDDSNFHDADQLEKIDLNDEEESEKGAISSFTDNLSGGRKVTIHRIVEDEVETSPEASDETFDVASPFFTPHELDVNDSVKHDMDGGSLVRRVATGSADGSGKPVNTSISLSSLSHWNDADRQDRVGHSNQHKHSDWVARESRPSSKKAVVFSVLLLLLVSSMAVWGAVDLSIDPELSQSDGADTVNSQLTASAVEGADSGFLAWLDQEVSGLWSALFGGDDGDNEESPDEFDDRLANRSSLESDRATTGATLLNGNSVDEWGTGGPVSESADRGLVVVQAEDDREAQEEFIRSQFSDEVIVKESSDTSGTIQPVFRNTRDTEYLYMMVPVEKSEQVNEQSTTTPASTTTDS